MLETARYVLALLMVAMLPWAVLFWYVVHPFVGFWRRRGATFTYTILGLGGVPFLAAAWHWRDGLLAVRYGTGPGWWIAAGLCYAIASAIEVSCRRHLTWRMLVGLPEIEPQRRPARLLQEGIYARVRHPRYVSVTFGMLAMALFCNYLATWVLFVVWLALLPGLVAFEERELIERFGREYIEYARRVPRFVPVLGRAARGSSLPPMPPGSSSPPFASPGAAVRPSSSSSANPPQEPQEPA